MHEERVECLPDPASEPDSEFEFGARARVASALLAACDGCSGCSIIYCAVKP